MPSKIPFRQYAAGHVEKAKTLLGGGEDELRYACLELRLAIEALVYETLQTYAEDDHPEVEKALRGWKPGAILEQLAKYDPVVEVPLYMEFRLVMPDGKTASEEQVITGTDDRFDAKWARDAHHAMSKLLHQRTIAKFRDGSIFDEAHLRQEAARVMERLEQILASDFHSVRSDIRFVYDCPAEGCGGSVGVPMLPLLALKQIVVLCESCNQNWRVESGGESGQPIFTQV